MNRQARLSSLQQRRRPPGEVVGRITVGVLVANIEGRVLVSYQRGLIDEVGHGLLVTFGADIQTYLVCRSGWVSPCPFLPVSLGLVDGP